MALPRPSWSRLTALLRRALPGPRGVLKRLAREADALRDADAPAAAAEVYAQALALAPDHWGLRVQLANMLKDSGRFDEAERVYRDCIRRRPEDADVRVQLGHALKIAGRRDEAAESYEAALTLDPSLGAIRRELVALGRAERHAETLAALERGWSRDPLPEVLARMAALEAALVALRDQLPDAMRLSCFPLSVYSMFRALWGRFPAAPPAPLIRALFVVNCESGAGGDALAVLAAAQAQTAGDWRLLGLGAGSAAALAPLAAEPRAAAAADASGVTVASVFAGWRPDWVIALTDGALPDPRALEWLAAIPQPAAAAVTDEETRETEASGAPRCFRPRLRRAVDHEGVLSGELDGAVAVVATDAWEAAWAAAAQDGEGLAGAAAAALLDLSAQGRVAHLPLPLFHRPPDCADPGGDPARHLARVRRHLARTGLSGVEAAPSSTHPGALRVDWPSRPEMRIAVAIPSRDNAAQLGAMVASLSALAARPERLEILVLDNGAGAADADPPAGAARLRRLPTPGPFNWAQLNNRAARETDAETLVFANDDMTMLTRGWDERLAGHLDRVEIGVVGARLLYPSGGVQHAGILTGWPSGVIHDGLDAAAEDPGPEGRWRRPRRAAAVTGAFLATRRRDFKALGGFDETALPVSYSDVDYAFRVRAAGMAVLFDPEIELVHHESKSRGLDHWSADRAARAAAERRVFEARWGVWATVDPGLNPAFAAFGRPCQHLRAPPRAVLLRHVALCASGRPWAICENPPATTPERDVGAGHCSQPQWPLP